MIQLIIIRIVRYQCYICIRDYVTLWKFINLHWPMLLSKVPIWQTGMDRNGHVCTCPVKSSDRDLSKSKRARRIKFRGVIHFAYKWISLSIRPRLLALCIPWPNGWPSKYDEKSDLIYMGVFHFLIRALQRYVL